MEAAMTDTGLVGLTSYLTLAAILFAISIAGIFLNSKKYCGFTDVYRADVVGCKY